MIEVRRDGFSLDKIIERMRSPKIGVILTYLGTVREFPSGRGLEFENNESAIQKLLEIEKKARTSFDIEDVAIIHRVGPLLVSENILLVAVSASHRGAAFDACKSMIDEIKDLHESWGKELLAEENYG